MRAGLILFLYQLISTLAWAQARPNIIGGHAVNPPSYFVSLVELDRGGELTPTCGGTLISNSLVLTAAHCVDGYKVEAVAFGVKSLEEFDRALMVKPKYIFIHAKYDSQTLKQDIALIVLEDYDKSQHPYPIKPIGIASEIPANVDLEVTGFGNASSYGWLFLSQLMAVTVPRISTAICRTMGELYADVDDTQICAGLAQGSQDSCSGDSGGPLVMQINGVTELVGVVSYGEGCALEGRPGVYTNASVYKNWLNEIQATMAKSESQVGAKEASLLMDAGCLEQDFEIHDSEESASGTARLKLKYFVHGGDYRLASEPRPSTWNRLSSCRRRINSQLVMERVLYSSGEARPENLMMEIIVGDRVFRSHLEILNYQDEITCGTPAALLQWRWGSVTTENGFFYSEPVTRLPSGVHAVRECKVHDLAVTLFEAESGELFLRRSGSFPGASGPLVLKLLKAEEPSLLVTFRPQQSTASGVSGEFEISNTSYEDVFTWQMRCNFRFALENQSVTSMQSQVFFAGQGPRGHLQAGATLRMSFRADSFANPASLRCWVNEVPVVLQFQ